MSERACRTFLTPSLSSSLFWFAAAMEVDTDLKQELLEMRSTSERLRRLRDMLARAVAQL